MNGCNAMEQVFHIACFVCINCGKLSYSFDCLVILSMFTLRVVLHAFFLNKEFFSR